MGQVASVLTDALLCVLLEKMAQDYEELKKELDVKRIEYLDIVYDCLSKIAHKADNAEYTQNLIALVTNISTYTHQLLVNIKAKNFLEGLKKVGNKLMEVAVELMKVGGTGVSDFQKELQCEIEFVEGKLEEIVQLIHKIENGSYSKLSSFSQTVKNESALKNLVQEFDNSVSEIKTCMKECEKHLKISYEKVHDFLRRRRIARIAGIATAIVGVAATVVTLSNPVTAGVAAVAYVAGVTAAASGTTIAVLNRDNEEEQRFREIEEDILSTIESSRKEWNEAIGKLIGFISYLLSININVAKW